MGFFDRFRKKELENVSFEELEPWLDKFLVQKELDKRMQSLNEQTLIKISEIRDALEKLENTELMNKNIPERAIQIMEGNRKSYIRRMNYFLDNFELPENVMDISDFSKKLSEQLTELSEETQKNYYVLKEFMEHDAYAVAKKMKELEKLMHKTSSELEKENIHSTQSVKKKLESYRKDLEHLEELEKERKGEEAKLQELKAKEEKIKKRISDLKTSKDLERFNKLQEEKEKNLERIKKEEDKIYSHFSTLERPLRKYKRGSLDEDLINRYLVSHIEALKDDSELNIVEVLGKLKENVHKLDLKEKQQGKVIETVQKLNKEFFIRRKVELEKLDHKKNEIKRQMTGNVIMMHLIEQEAFLDNNQTITHVQQRKVDEIQRKMDNIMPEKVQKEIKEELKDTVNVILDETAE